MRGKQRIRDLACFGGPKLFERFLHVGQLNLPDWDAFESAMCGVFDRGFYTNHGPKVRELEEALARRLGVRHAVCVVNGTTALMLAAKALGLHGEVIVPAFTFIATAQALAWAGLDPVFCDVDPATHTLDPSRAAALVTDRTSAILGVHLWGRACDVGPLEDLARARGLHLFFDAAHAVGCSHRGRMIGSLGEVEVFSMHATKVLNATEGGFATTNDDALAERLRSLRSFHASEARGRTGFRINAKMSEAQAEMGLLSLDQLEENCRRNRRLYSAYINRLAKVSGLAPVRFDERESNNYQYLILDVEAGASGLSRDDLVFLLEREGVLARKYFTPGIHRAPPFCDQYPQFVEALPVTDALSRRLMQLPVGQGVTEDDVERVCDCLAFCLENGRDIKARLDRLPSGEGSR